MYLRLGSLTVYTLPWYVIRLSPLLGVKVLQPLTVRSKMTTTHVYHPPRKKTVYMLAA